MARKTGWGETLLGLAILAVLAGVGAAVYFEQFRPHPAAAAADRPDYHPPPASRPAAPPRPSRVNPPDGMAALGPSEFFDPDTLYEKIDGRAELYLPAGFQSLECRRLGLPDDEDSVVEVFLYDMGSARSAYAVFSLQQREDAEPRDFTRYAYLAENALFFCHGPYYLEIVAGTADAAARDALRRTATQLMADLPAEPVDLPEAALLPEAHRLPGHPRLYRADGLGFALLTDLVVADYQIGEFSLSGFVCARGSEADAAKLAQAYQQYIMDDGAMLQTPIPELPDARVLDFYGTWQVLFTRGRYFAGVHQAGDRLSAEQLALLLDRQLSEPAP